MFIICLKFVYSDAQYFRITNIYELGAQEGYVNLSFTKY